MQQTYFTGPDARVFDMSSNCMDMIKVIFWDKRPILNENLHSTINGLSPTRYHFLENMIFANNLEKPLIGIP